MKKSAEEKGRLAEIFDVGDPLNYWTHLALESASRLNLNSRLVADTVPIIENALGKEWFGSESKKKFQDMWTGLLKQHPLVHSFEIPGDSHIVEPVELGFYLKELARIPSIEKVIANLRNVNDYKSALLQLAFCYRFKEVGGQAIRLEPPAANDRVGDLAFSLKGQSYLAECYIPSFREVDTSFEYITHTVEGISEVAPDLDGRICVCIRMKRELNPGEHKVVTAIGRRLIHQLKTEQMVTDTCDVADIAIFKIEEDAMVTSMVRKIGSSFGIHEEADHFGQSVKIRRTKETIERVRKGLSVEKIPGSYFAIWRAQRRTDPWDEEDARIDELVNRFDKKLPQTKDGQGSKRILIAQVAEAITIAKGDKTNPKVTRVLKAVQNQLVTKHQGIAALFLVSRVWTDKLRYRYTSYALQGRKEDALPDDVQYQLALIDFRLNFLDNK